MRWLLRLFEKIPHSLRIPVLAVGVVLLICALLYGGQRLGSYITQKQFEKARAARLKESQEHLLLAEKATKAAEEKEAKAEALEKINAQKLGQNQANVKALDEKDRQASERIANDAKRDQEFINSNLSDCERCSDICSRRKRLSDAAGKPEWVCPSDACADVCQ